MNVDYFLNEIQELGVNFYTGVPDSKLKPLCDTLYVRFGIGRQHIVAANEGGAVGLAAGHYLATGQPALVYMQNSGIGNTINPIASLLDEKVYGIPCVFVVGWRGEPGEKDEPQHAFQGEITVELLELMNIHCFVLTETTTNEEFTAFLEQSRTIIDSGRSIAFVVKKKGLTSGVKAEYKNGASLHREEALKILVQQANPNDIFVSTTGKTSRELFEIREALQQKHEKDFLTVGSMGHASMIALGIALEHPDRTVWCIDGDGAALMHLGCMVVAAQINCTNMIHVVLNNGAHESVGGMPVANGKVNFCDLARAAGYDACHRVYSEEDLISYIANVEKQNKTKFIEIIVSLGSRENLGRPTTTPKENKNAFMSFLKG
jgi:phosphonopyruvate decarboxylase